MEYVRRNSYTLVTEDCKYSIVKNHSTNTYFIKSEGKKLIHGNSRLTFRRQKDAKAFVEKIYREGLNDAYKWL